ncbi:MAG: SRPBCC family protein [Acidimicrobiales bacterium]
MAVNRIRVEASPEIVFGVLSDPRTYGGFVVGAKRIRHFDPRWPEVGTQIHHTLGVGPFILRDRSRILEADPPNRLVMRARMMPLWINRVEFVLTPQGAGTDVEMTEVAIGGPGARVWHLGLNQAMAARNSWTLLRLRRTAEERNRRQARIEPGRQNPGTPAADAQAVARTTSGD